MTSETGPERETADVIGFPPLYFVGPLVAGLALQRAFPLRFLPRVLARLTGFSLVAAGLALGGWAFATMRRADTSPDPHRPVRALVTAGPFGVTRNPIYLGMGLIYLGVAALANALWPLLWFPAVVRAVRRGVIDREERYLARRFGPDYAAYRQRVPRWF